MSRDFSIVEYFAEHEGYRCGYCKSPNTNYSHGMWAHTMTVEDYQDLIDRGWRRSGKYCYKPTMDHTCCPMYTIRSSALDFQPSKSQKKLMKRMHHYLSHGTTHPNSSVTTNSASNEADNEASGACEEEAVMSDGPVPARHKPTEKNMDCSQVKLISGEVSNKMETTSAARSKGEAPPAAPENDSTQAKKSSSAPRPGEGPDAARPPCKKAKVLRQQRKMEKLVARALLSQTMQGTEQQKPQQQQNTSKPEGKSLEDFLNEPLPDSPAHHLEVRLVRSDPPSEEFKSSFQQSYQLYAKYQQTIHRDPPEKCVVKQFSRFLVNSPLQSFWGRSNKPMKCPVPSKVRLIMVRSSPASDKFRETFEASYQVYQKYQTQIHKESPEECGREEFRQFLVDSPLQAWKPSWGPPMGFGSFHQQYWLDGRLVAVGVVDILPRCLSSVYFYYDPALGFLSLGTYGSLRELALVRSLSRSVRNFTHYYMGFYIHSCPKMRYKGQLYPSFLLCPEAYTWQPIERCRPKLDASPYAKLDEDPKAKDADTPTNSLDVIVLYKSEAMPYSIYARRTASLTNSRDQEDEEVAQYAQLVGQKEAVVDMAMREVAVKLLKNLL